MEFERAAANEAEGAGLLSLVASVSVVYELVPVMGPDDK